MKRVFFVSLFLSLSLSEEQTKGAKRTKILSRAFKKKLSFSLKEQLFPSVCSFSFFTFHTKSMKKKAERFLVYPNRFNEERFLYISSEVTLFLLRRLLACSRKRESIGRKKNTHTHTQSIIVSWRERCTCSPR